MEIEQLRKELNHLLESVVDHSQQFSKGRQIPSLEIGVVLAKINKMQENLAILRHLLQEQENRIKEEKKSFKLQQQEPILTKKEVVQAEEIKVPEPEIQEVAKEFKSETTTPSADSISEKLQHSPISKLVDAFNLNDRYLYANELFNKDMSAFNELIKVIDNCTNLSEAQNSINETKSTYNWDDENQMVIDFLILVERRFL